MSYSEITFTSDFRQAVASLAMAKINIEAYRYDLNATSAMVVSDDKLNTVTALIDGVTSIASVDVEHVPDVPGSLQRIMMKYRNVPLSEVYPASSDRVIVKSIIRT